MIPDTILVRHLSPSLTHEEKSDLLKHFGALEVNIVGPETKKCNLVYARYKSAAEAEAAVRRLHQLNVLGHRISAEIATGKSHQSVEAVTPSLLNVNDQKQDQILKAKETFLKKLSLSIKNYDFNQPPPLHLRYQYPPPTRLVLENISKAMANFPNFYNQVLHLMNKMNLPCPFTENYPIESELFKISEPLPPPPLPEGFLQMGENLLNEESTSDEGSEIGSDSEKKPGEIIPAKRKKLQKQVLKRPKFVKPPAQPVQSSKLGLKADDVFEHPQLDQVQKKIELKISADLSSIQEAKEIQSTEDTREGFGVIKAPVKVAEKPEELENLEERSSKVDDTSFAFITAEELAANRISTKDQKVLPVFKNYQAGAPSCRLYVKNLAKQVETRDLHFIFRRYYRPELDQVQGSMFDVRLMQEGRMKGQAFITLQSVSQAQEALRETNGFILKDKPMVVQFARSSAAK